MTCLPLPDFITSARREERVSPDFLVLTILNVLGGWLVRRFVGWLATEEEKFAQMKIRSSVERALTTRDIDHVVEYRFPMLFSATETGSQVLPRLRGFDSLHFLTSTPCSPFPFPILSFILHTSVFSHNG